MNIVIPMAGEGSRFVKAGYKTPKPFIEVNGTTLIEIVLNNLQVDGAHYILIARTEHLKNQSRVVKRIQEKFNVTFFPVDCLTEGAACTVLHAHRIINNKAPLLLANSDQYIEMDVSKYLQDAKDRSLDGSILTFIDQKRDPKWSFASIDSTGLVQNVKEKVAISNNATVGLYYFAQGNFFVDAAIDMIVAKDRVNGEFYTAPIYNYCIAANQKIGIYNIQQEQMHGLGTPEDLNKFIVAYPHGINHHSSCRP